VRARSWGYVTQDTVISTTFAAAKGPASRTGVSIETAQQKVDLPTVKEALDSLMQEPPVMPKEQLHSYEPKRSQLKPAHKPVASPHHTEVLPSDGTSEQKPKKGKELLGDELKPGEIAQRYPAFVYMSWLVCVFFVSHIFGNSLREQDIFVAALIRPVLVIQAQIFVVVIDVSLLALFALSARHLGQCSDADNGCNMLSVDGTAFATAIGSCLALLQRRGGKYLLSAVGVVEANPDSKSPNAVKGNAPAVEAEKELMAASLSRQALTLNPFIVWPLIFSPTLHMAANDSGLLNQVSLETMWLPLCLIVGTAAVAAPGVQMTLEFLQKLNKAKSGDRYGSIDNYDDLQDDSKTDTKGREDSYASLVNAYYDLATEFYEWGWGTSFHFSDRRKGESFKSSILRHETYLAGRLGVNRGAKLLDCGCGVGGPARNIAQFTGAHVTGITINHFQVQRGNTLTAQQGLSDSVKLIQGDFMKLPFPDNSFDGVYAIEATCHAPDRHGVYSEILRVLKPGGIFATYEWCLTDSFDKNNAYHLKIKKDIEVGDGLPDMCHTSVCTKAVETVGFELVEARDCAFDGHEGGDPWYLPLSPSWKPWAWPRFQFNPVMFFLMPKILSTLETIGIVPPGTSKTQVMLQAGGVGCEQGGVNGTFTPMWLMVGRKPLKVAEHA